MNNSVNHIDLLVNTFHCYGIPEIQVSGSQTMPVNLSMSSGSADASYVIQNVIGHLQLKNVVCNVSVIEWEDSANNVYRVYMLYRLLYVVTVFTVYTIR